MDKIIISLLLLSGSFFILVAALGLLRFKDLYSRLHAGTKAPSFGIFLIVLGVCFFFHTPVVYIKGLFVVLFIYLTAPLAAHSIVKSYRGNPEKSEKSDEDL